MCEPPLVKLMLLMPPPGIRAARRLPSRLKLPRGVGFGQVVVVPAAHDGTWHCWRTAASVKRLHPKACIALRASAAPRLCGFHVMGKGRVFLRSCAVWLQGHCTGPAHSRLSSEMPVELWSPACYQTPAYHDRLKLRLWVQFPTAIGQLPLGALWSVVAALASCATAFRAAGPNQRAKSIQGKERP